MQKYSLNLNSAISVKNILCYFALSVNLQNLAEEKIVLNTIFNLILFQSGYGLGIMDKQRESN